jgi:cytochrome oxidase assembly protein ShyY1
MTAVARQRGTFGLAIIAAIMVLVLTALGVWQLQRRTEKHRLIAALTERLATAPVPLPPPAQWPTLQQERDEFRRVTFTATYAAKPDAMVYSSGSAVRTDVSGPGTWAFLPARLPSGEIVTVNAGFVPNTMQERPQQDRAVAPLITGQAVSLTGYLRFPDLGGLLTPADNPGKRLWFTRDPQSMARTLGWTEPSQGIAPFYIDLETPAPPSGVPKPGPLDVNLKDNHLQYAITWFGLAIVVLGAFAAWVMQNRRQG